MVTSFFYGGSGGIRTHEPRERLPDFESGNHLGRCQKKVVKAALCKTLETALNQGLLDFFSQKSYTYAVS